MQCTEFHHHIDELLDDQLSEAEAVAMASHHERCSSCREAVRAERELREQLRDLPVPAASEGFAVRALHHAATVNASSASSRPSPAFAAGFAAALVVGIVLWFVTGIYGTDGEYGSAQPQLAELSISLHETRRVRLAVNSPEDIESVRVLLVLPDHVELAGYPGRKQVAWYTKLKKGDNVLNLPFTALREDKGMFTARVGTGKHAKTLQFYLNVDPVKPGLSTLGGLVPA